MRTARQEYAWQWHLKNRTRRLADRKLRYKAHRAEELAQCKIWAANNKGKVRAAQKKYRSKPGFKELNRKRVAQWRAKKPDKDKAIWMRYMTKHYSVILARNRKWSRSRRLLEV